MKKARIPEGTSGDWKVSHFEIKEEDLRFDFHNRMVGRQATPGKYTKLTRNNKIIMSDTPAELSDLGPLKYKAEGRVLVHGLGLGCAVDLLMDLPNVKDVTVIEQSHDVIMLAGKTLKGRYGDRLSIINADAFEWKPKGAKFDSIWSDIWDDICSDNLKEMERLRRMWVRRTKWHGHWCRIECLQAKRRYA